MDFRVQSSFPDCAVNPILAVKRAESGIESGKMGSRVKLV